MRLGRSMMMFLLSLRRVSLENDQRWMRPGWIGKHQQCRMLYASQYVLNRQAKQ